MDGKAGASHEQLIGVIDTVTKRMDEIHGNISARMDEHRSLLTGLVRDVEATTISLGEINTTLYRANGKKPLVSIVQDHEEYIKEQRDKEKEVRNYRKNSLWGVYTNVATFITTGILGIILLKNLGLSF